MTDLLKMVLQWLLTLLGYRHRATELICGSAAASGFGLPSAGSIIRWGLSADRFGIDRLNYGGAPNSLAWLPRRCVEYVPLRPGPFGGSMSPALRMGIGQLQTAGARSAAYGFGCFEVPHSLTATG